MLSAGQIIKTQSGCRIEVHSLLRAGGQGEAYMGRSLDSGHMGVLKVYHEKLATPDNARRLQFLAGQQLSRVCSVLLAPQDIILQGRTVGHWCSFAPGKPLEELLQHPDSTFLESLGLALSLAHAIKVLHERQIGHGDLHADNLLVQRQGRVLELSLIDFDNFWAPSLPPPPCLGHLLYLAPELRRPRPGSRAIPDIQSELFTLGVLMHEIILFRHLAARPGISPEEFEEAMCSGRWSDDPAAAGAAASTVGGYPATVLNAGLARLFRYSVSQNRNERPSAAAWEAELASAIHHVFLCPRCSGPCVLDTAKTACPNCQRPFPMMCLIVRGRAIPVDSGAQLLGRADLGGSPKVSTRHVVLRRIGPETWLESTGLNGTYRWTGSQWLRLPDSKRILLQAGDRLRFADVETEVREA